MAAQVEIAVDALIAKQAGGKILHESISTYDEAYTYDGLDDNDHIPKRVLTEKITESAVFGYQFAVVSGSPIPFNVDLTETSFQNGIIAKVELSISASKSRIIYDVPIDSNFDTDTGLITDIDVYGHDSGDGETTQDDLIVTIYAIAVSI